jgi:MFS family permease
VIGYVLAGPIANQVLIARWFHRRRGRAMGYAYLGLGLGGVTAPMLVNFLARYLGPRLASRSGVAWSTHTGCAFPHRHSGHTLFAGRLRRSSRILR